MDLIIKKYSEQYHIPESFLRAIIKQETNFNPYACRFEPLWRWQLDPAKYSTALRITYETERMMQATSWGPAQIMGTVARELGFTDHLTKLVDPEISLRLSCMKLEKLYIKYGNLIHVAAAYNAGAVRVLNNKLINQPYVDNVMGEYERLEKESGKTTVTIRNATE